MPKRVPVFVGLVLATALLAALVWRARGGPAASGEEEIGLRLARRYCTTCHQLPSPSHLPRESWPYVIDWMGNYLGIRNTEGYLANVVNGQRVPQRPVATEEELAAIQAYYAGHAPPAPLRPRDKPAVHEGLEWLRPTEKAFLSARNAIVTLLEIDEANRRLFVGHGNENRLRIYGAGGEPRASVQFDTQPIDVTVHDEGFYLALIGDLMRDRRNGQLYDLRLEEGEVRGDGLAGGLPRTVDADFHDLNGDGLTDALVSGFGDFATGRLFWLERLPAGGYREHVLLDHAGALGAEVHDFDRDGRPDVMTLVAQEREQLLLFLNRGDGRFEQIQLLQRFPAFGFNGFQLADFDDDGRIDVLLVNGNNLEFPDAPLRDYHGLRIYLNQGDLRFREAYFYPMYGAIGARVADFDGDGRQDIAAVAAFPDWSADHPEGFVLLQQTGPLQFTPRTHPATRGGRWMTLDAGDLNGDGSVDLVLGGAAFLHGIPAPLQSDFIQHFNQLPPVLVLENSLATPHMEAAPPRAARAPL